MGELLTWIVRLNGSTMAGFANREDALEWIGNKDFSSGQEWSLKYFSD